MWDDVIIGTGNKGNSAIHVFEVNGDDHRISQNSVSYWISDVYLGMGMTIFKNTEEGQQLTAYIKNKVHVDAIYDWLVDLIFKYAKPHRLTTAIAAAKEEAYEKGREDAQADIRRALGLDR